MLNLIPKNHPHLRRRKNRRRRTVIFWVVGGTIGLYLLASAAVFFAVKFHYTDVAGAVDPNTQQYNDVAAAQSIGTASAQLPVVADKNVAELQARKDAANCRIDALGRLWPNTAARIIQSRQAGADIDVVERMLFAAKLRLDAGSPVLGVWDTCGDTTTSVTMPTATQNTSDLFPWANTPEWDTVQAAFRKDAPTILRASQDTGVPPRMIVAAAMVEQLRLYFTEREIFEKIFQPLKILGSATQFAWGVMAIKETTATDIENHLTDTRSPWYLGSANAHLLDYASGQDPKIERFNRLTDEHNHYYSYKYGALELKQLMSQWERAGFPIGSRPEILATLFNIGFGKSKPSDHPAVGGSTLTIANTSYTFGGLAYEWYYSGTLTDVFPYPTQ